MKRVIRLDLNEEQAAALIASLGASLIISGQPSGLPAGGALAMAEYTILRGENMPPIVRGIIISLWKALGEQVPE